MAEDDRDGTGTGLTKAEASDLLDKVGKGGLWAVVASGGDPAAFALGVAKGGFVWVWDRVRDWYSASLGRELEENAEGLAEGVQELVKRYPPHEVGIDFNALLRAWAKASERSVGRKKRILMAALQHSLRADEEEYERGIGLEVLEALEGLDYGDILTLRKVAQEVAAIQEARKTTTGSAPSRKPLSAGDHWHAVRLIDRGLMTGNTQMNPREVKGALLTWFGHKVLEYVQADFADHVRKKDQEAQG